MISESFREAAASLVDEAWTLARSNGLEQIVRKELAVALDDHAGLIRPASTDNIAALGLYFIIANWEGCKLDDALGDQDYLYQLCRSYTILGSLNTALGERLGSFNLREYIEKETRSKIAKKAAMAMLANDPKQAAKAHVKECWNDWQKKPTNYKGKSAFAKDMMAKFEELDNQAVITRWCGQWEKEAAS